MLQFVKTIMKAINYGILEKELAESEKKGQKMWRIKCLKHDISLPLHNIEKFHNEAQSNVKQEVPNCRTIYFGHLGDGNLHYNVFGDGRLPDGFNNKSLK